MYRKIAGFFRPMPNREPSHRGGCAQNLQTCGLNNFDDVTYVPIFSAYPMSAYMR